MFNPVAVTNLVTSRPRLFIAFGMLVILIASIGLHKLVKNTSTDAFIPSGHPSLISRDNINQTFGLKDPIIVSIEATQGDAFTPTILTQLSRLHKTLESIDNVRAGGVKSLFSESHISASGEQLVINPLPVGDTSSLAEALNIKQAVSSMESFYGTLVAYDHSALAIVMELLNQEEADKTYLEVINVVDSFSEGVDGVRFHVAGQGAVGGYLSQYIDSDSRRMQPVVVAMILLLLFLAFRQGKGLLAPLIVIVSSALGTIGVMAWLGVPYYAITSALPVVIIAIAVADSIHVLTSYYELRMIQPDKDVKLLASAAVLDMWRPITLTTLTTIAGFVGLAIASVMPPVTYFGAFAALGVCIAWVFSILVLPALIVVMDLPASSVFRVQNNGALNLLGDALTRVAVTAVSHPFKCTALLIVVFVGAFFGALQLKVDRAQIENFKADEPIRIAHSHLNSKYAGSSYLDIVIRAAEPDGLLEHQTLQKVSALQDFLEAQPSVNKTLAITDYLSKLNSVLTGVSADRENLPSDADTLAQYLLLYEASSDIADFSDEIDNQYQQMLVRAYLGSDYFSQEKQLVEQTHAYLDTNFSNGNVSVELSGRVNLDYHWMTRLGQSHFISIAISLALVILIASLLFRSFYKGAVALLPVLYSIVLVYGVMGWSGIFLEPATSMFAAIAIGVGVDFSIHFIERLELATHKTPNLISALQQKFPSASRACFFNAAALASGFATLLVSELPTLQRFGLMITIACMTSFFAALLIVPLAWRLKSALSNIRSGALTQPVVS